MTPDTPTLFIVGAIICGLAAVLQWLVARHRHAPALLVWAGANLAFSLGCVIHAGRPFMPLPLSVLLGNGLLILGTGLMLAGLDVFGGRRPGWRELLAGPILAMAALGLVLVRGEQPGELALIMSLAIAYYVVRAGIALWRLPNAGMVGVRIACSLLMLAFAASYVLRGVATYADLLDSASAARGLVGGLVRIFALAMAAAWSVCSLVLVLDREASLDHLTGLLNRRATLASGRRLLAEAAAKQLPLAVLALDVDHFKQVNDRYGHHAGDEALRILARLVTETVRGGDVVGRLGGEEFCIILPLADKTQAQQVAERLRLRCERSLARDMQLPSEITVSIGVATLLPSDTGFIGLFRRADAALYRAKTQGRNRVVSAASTDGEAPGLQNRRV